MSLHDAAHRITRSLRKQLDHDERKHSLSDATDASLPASIPSSAQPPQRTSSFLHSPATAPSATAFAPPAYYPHDNRHSFFNRLSTMLDKMVQAAALPFHGSSLDEWRAYFTTFSVSLQNTFRQYPSGKLTLAHLLTLQKIDWISAAATILSTDFTLASLSVSRFIVNRMLLCINFTDLYQGKIISKYL